MHEFKPAAVKPTISLADIEKIDVRVGTIVAVEEVGQSAKLLKLTVDFGDHQRTILAGMKQERKRATIRPNRDHPRSDVCYLSRGLARF